MKPKEQRMRHQRSRTLPSSFDLLHDIKTIEHLYSRLKHARWEVKSLEGLMKMYKIREEEV
jgi:hypothetical protein